MQNVNRFFFCQMMERVMYGCTKDWQFRDIKFDIYYYKNWEDAVIQKWKFIITKVWFHILHIVIFIRLSIEGRPLFTLISCNVCQNLNCMIHYFQFTFWIIKHLLVVIIILLVVKHNSYSHGSKAITTVAECHTHHHQH